MIVSARNASAIYAIIERPADPGGRRQARRVPPDAPPERVFCTQHDVHRLPAADLMIFDNGGTAHHRLPRAVRCIPRACRCSSSIRPSRQVRLLRTSARWVSGSPAAAWLSRWVGSAVPQSNGDMLVDWGSCPARQLDRAGRAREALLRLSYWSYRAAPTTWVGRPAGRRRWSPSAQRARHAVGELERRDRVNAGRSSPARARAPVAGRPGAVRGSRDADDRHHRVDVRGRACARRGRPPPGQLPRGYRPARLRRPWAGRPAVPTRARHGWSRRAGGR